MIALHPTHISECPIESAEQAIELEQMGKDRYSGLVDTLEFQKLRNDFELARDLIQPMINANTLSVGAQLYAELQSDSATSPLAQVLIDGYTIDGMFGRLKRLKLSKNA